MERKKDWYLFTPEIGQEINPMDPKQYTPYQVGIKRPANTDTTGEIYAIQTSSTEDGLPIIDPALCAEILEAMLEGHNSENIILRYEHQGPNIFVESWYQI